MAGVGQKPRKSDTKAKPAMSPASPNASGGKTDQQFLTGAAKDGMMEMHMGQMAQKEGQSDEVKKLGAMIAADHQKANNELMALAQKKGLKLDTRHRMDKMSKKDRANFDQAWLAMMLNDHQRDIAFYQAEVQRGTDPEVQAFAKKTLPVLQKHLKAVQAAQKKIGSGATAPNAMAPAGTTKSSGR